MYCEIFKKLFLCLIVFSFSCNAYSAIVPSPPALNANSHILMDYNSGRILAQNRINERIEPASMSKMMTVYVIASALKEGQIKSEDMVTISEKAWRMEGSKMFIEVNKQVSVDDLLKGVIVQSGNDASVALAEYIAGTEEVFATIMNQYAAELGLKNTHFTNSSGLPDENHYSSAWDLAVIASSLIREFPDIYTYHSIREFTFNGIHQHNRNDILSRDDSVDGIKTGYTESAGYCLVASARRGDMRLISVVAGTPSSDARASATQSLLNYGFRFFTTEKIFSAEQSVVSARVWKGDLDSINLGTARDLWVTVPRGKSKDLDKNIELQPTIIAPTLKGAIIGHINISYDGEELAVRPLIALESVQQGDLLDRIMDDIRLLFQ